MVKMASNYRSISDICSTAPPQNYICSFTDKIIKTNISAKKKRFYKILSNRNDELNKKVLFTNKIMPFLQQ